MAFDGLEPKSLKVIALGFAVLLLVIGTSFMGGLMTYAKSILLLAAATILTFEIGIKNIKNYKRDRNVTTWIGVSLILVLAAGAIFGLTSLPIPNIIVTLLDYVLVVSAVWIGVEAFL